MNTIEGFAIQTQTQIEPQQRVGLFQKFREAWNTWIILRAIARTERAFAAGKCIKLERVDQLFD